MLKLLKIGLRGGSHKNENGDVLLDFKPDAQERIFQDAFERSWNVLEREGPAPTLQTASDTELTLIRYSDLVLAVTEEKSRAVKIVKAQEAQAAAAKLAKSWKVRRKVRKYRATLAKRRQTLTPR